MIQATDMILVIYPKLNDRLFLKKLRQRFREHGFSDKRVMASVNHVIDNYQGWNKDPNIADFIQYDKKVKLYTHDEAIEFGMKDLQSIDFGLSMPR